jgi:hypothetical protein
MILIHVDNEARITVISDKKGSDSLHPSLGLQVIIVVVGLEEFSGALASCTTWQPFSLGSNFGQRKNRFL